MNLFTQEQVNAINANTRRSAVESFFTKELGLKESLPPDVVKQALLDAEELRKQREGEKTEMEKLTGELDEARKHEATVKERDTQILRARIASDAGLKSRYWKYVEGSSEDEVKASIQDILKDISNGDGEGQGETQDAGGRPPAPNPQQGHGGGGKPAGSMSAGAEAYRARHKVKE